MAIRAVLFDFGVTLLDMSTDNEAHRRASVWLAEAWTLPVDGGTLWRDHQEYKAPFWRGQPEVWRPLRDLREAAAVIEGWVR